MEPSQEAQLMLRLINLSSGVHRKLGGALSMHGLGVSEYLVLSELKNAPRQTMRRVDLAEKVGLTASGVTRVLNPMEKIGLVEKTASAGDARVSLVALSEAGERTLDASRLAVNETAHALLGALDSQRQQDLDALIQALT